MKKHNKSYQYYQDAIKVIPGGVNSPVRAFQSVGMSPIFIDYGKGATVYDVDGNAYTDYIGSWGPLILGHGSPVYTEGVVERLEKGSTFGVPTAVEIALAETIIEAIPSIEMVRMVNSGTEATMSAIRLARGYTGKDKFIKFEGCYHGHSDALLVKSGSGTLTYGVPTSAGVTAGAAKDTLVATYNDLDSVAALFDSYPDEIACVIVEPVAGNMGVVPPAQGFLKDLRKLTEEKGALLIFDEVITGFRLDYGGAQNYFNVQPDLTTLGKIIGGGMPVGAFGGKREIMEKLAPTGPVYQAGTLSGNPVAMTMGLNTLQYLKTHPEIYTFMEDMATCLEKGFLDNAKEANIPIAVNRIGGMLSMFFTDKKVEDYASVMGSDTDRYAQYFKEMLDLGQLLPPAQFEGIFLSAAHSKSIIEETLVAQRSAFKKIT